MVPSLSKTLWRNARRRASSSACMTTRCGFTVRARQRFRARSTPSPTSTGTARQQSPTPACRTRGSTGRWQRTRDAGSISTASSNTTRSWAWSSSAWTSSHGMKTEKTAAWASPDAATDANPTPGQWRTSQNRQRNTASSRRSSCHTATTTQRWRHATET